MAGLRPTPTPPAPMNPGMGMGESVQARSSVPLAQSPDAFMNPMGAAQQQMQFMNPMGSMPGNTPPTLTPQQAYGPEMAAALQAQGRQTRGYAEGITGLGAGNSTFRSYGFQPQAPTNAQMALRTPGGEQPWVNRTLQANQAAGSGPYDSAYGRYAGVAPQPQHVPTPPAPGTRYPGGSRVLQGPDGGQALIGVNDDREANRTIGINDAGGNSAYLNTSGNPAGHNFTPEQLEANRQESIARSRDKKGALAEGRRNRAIAKHGLDHLTPTSDYRYDANRGPHGGFRYNQSGTGPNGQGGYTPGSEPTESKAKRSATYNAARDKAFSEEDRKSFDPDVANLTQVRDRYGEVSGNMSQADRDSFREYVQAKAADNEEFRKEWDAFVKQTEFVSVDHPNMPGSNESRRGEFDKLNEFRRAMGLPELKWVGKPSNVTPSEGAAVGLI